MANDTTSSTDGSSDATRGTSAATDRPVRRRTFLKMTGATGAGVALAGCQANPEDGGSGGGGGGSDNASGSGSNSSGGALPDTITIGVLAPEPSDNPIGASIANAAKLARDQLNQNGGIAGKEVELSIKDTKEDPATGRQKYQELTVGEGVNATTGVFTSEVLLNIIDDIAQQQTVHMTSGAATPEASMRVKESYEQYKYHFRTGPINAHFLGVNMVDFVEAKASDLGWESVAVLVEDYEWTKPVSAVLDAQLGGTGLDVGLSTRYASGTENFSPIFDQVESAGVDAAFIGMAHTGTAAVVQWAKQQRPFEFGGIHVPMQLPSYYEAVSGACNYGVTQNSATPQSEVTEKTVPFANAYNEAFDSYPVYTGYITFDAIKQYASVVEEANSVAADDVVSGLENSSYLGTAGTIEYYGQEEEYPHDVIYAPDKVFPVFQQWQEKDGQGVQEVIFPDNLATAEYQKPAWIQ